MKLVFKALLACVGILVLIGVLGAWLSPGPVTGDAALLDRATVRDNAAAAKTADEPKKVTLQDRQSITALSQVKASMYNPDSFKLRSLLYITPIAGEAVGPVCAEYQGTNAFGAIIQQFMVVTPKGKMSSQPEVWNRFCTGKRTGVEHAKFALSQ
jgi:hypothetical protein